MCCLSSFPVINWAAVDFYMRNGRIVYLSVSLVYSRLSNFCRILYYRLSNGDVSGQVIIVVGLVGYFGIL